MLFELSHYIWDKLTSEAKFSHNLTIEVQNLSVSILLMEVSKRWKIVEATKISIKIKNFKTFYEAQTVIKAPHYIRGSNISGTKFFLRRFTGTYRHLLSKGLKNAILGRLEMVQCKCFFWQKPETCLPVNLWSEKDFWLCCGSTFFEIVGWVEVCKMIEIFWPKLHCKINHPFCLVWRLSTRISEIDR